MGQWEGCLFVLVGDHYQLNTHTVVRLTTCLAASLD